MYIEECGPEERTCDVLLAMMAAAKGGALGAVSLG